MGKDNQGHVYIGGNILSSNAQFGGLRVVTGTSYEIYLAKLDQDGKVLWVRTFRGKDGNSNHAYDIATDAQGNVYVTGRFSGPLHIGNTTLASVNDLYDTYVMKLDPNGTPVWAVSLGGTGEELSYGIAVDAGGQATISGYTTSTSLGGKALNAQGGRDLFVARFDSVGKLLWVTSLGTGDSDLAQDVALDAAGAAYFVGRGGRGTLRFGNNNISLAAVESTLFGKIDAKGAIQWVRFFPNSWGYGIALKESVAGGMLCVGGGIQQTSSFEETNLSSAGGQDGYLACLDLEGKLRWVRAFAGAGTSSRDFVRALAIDDRGQVHAAGMFDSPTLVVGTQSLQNKAAGKWDHFLVRYDSKGSLLLADSMGGSLVDETRHVCVSDTGGTFVFGNSESKDFSFNGKSYPFQSSTFAVFLYVGP